MCRIRKLHRHHIPILDRLRIFADILCVLHDLTGHTVCTEDLSPFFRSLCKKNLVAPPDDLFDGSGLLHGLDILVTRIVHDLLDTVQFRDFLLVLHILIAVYTDPTAIFALIYGVEGVTGPQRMWVQILPLELSLNHTDGVAPDSVGEERDVHLGPLSGLRSSIERHQDPRQKG